MPIRVQNDLPAKEILERENIFVMDEHRAVHQDIRPLKIGLLNLMPLKGYRASAFALVFQYAASGGCDFRDGVQSPVKEYIRESSK